MTDMHSIYQRGVAEGTIRPDPAQMAVLPAFDGIRESLIAPSRRSLFRKAPDPPGGLYLWGGVGRGKSMLMDLFVTSLQGIAVRRVHFHGFMQEIHAGLHAARQNGVEDALAPVADAVGQSLRCLAFDEMQITDITDAMIVGRLFERLFSHGVAVVATSNRKPGDLYKDGLNRQLFIPFINMIEEKLEVRELAGPTDYRQDRLVGETTYFAPANAAALAAIDAIWTDLGGESAEPLVLHIQRREVEIPLFINGVARAGFYDLCGQPLGPADYLALAEAVRVLILENVPRLSRANFNEAKRFVTLIDALYEARVRLIISAADAPEQLYLEGAGSFEFERTASRLREMQAADWGV
ncbi:MAG: cell division protein ZapE [Marinibacterium sp.]